MLDSLIAPKEPAWNKGKIMGQKRPLKLEEIWAIRIGLQTAKKIRDLALFNLAIDSKLRGCDLVRLRSNDVASGYSINSRAIIVQKKTGKPVQFEITRKTKDALSEWLSKSGAKGNEYLFKSAQDSENHLSVRQYAKIVKSWIQSIGLDPSANSSYHCFAS